jgi:hypothetical protein
MLGGALECFFLGRKLRKEREERRNTEQKECVARRVPRAGGENASRLDSRLKKNKM